MTRGVRLLLVSPAFHEYWRSIARGFEANGHRVSIHCYDDHAGLRAKARNKIAYEGLDRVVPGAGTKRQVEAATATAREAFAQMRPDVLVVVKGDLLGDAFWDDVDRAGTPRVLWLYDEIRRTRHDVESLARHPSIASYSPDDVAMLARAGCPAAVVPLAFDPDCVGQRRESREVVFIGARYQRREELLSELVAHGVPIRAVGRDWSPRVVDRLRTWSWSRPSIPAQTAVARDAAAGMMAGALATLNIHGDQDGFTMRTFEASGVGALQLIDREDVGVHYEPGKEILVCPDAEGIAEAVARARREPAWARRISDAARARTLAEHTFAHRAARLEELWA